MIIDGRYFLDDPETGLYEVSQEDYEAYQKIQEDLKSMFSLKVMDDSIKGKILITSAPVEDGCDTFEFRKLWEQNL